MNRSELIETAQRIVADGKGVLAADESTPTIGKRFASIGAESTDEKRAEYRGLLFETEGMEEYISGVIMYDETIRQSSLNERIPFTKLLSEKGVLSGIKVDAGAKPLAGHPNEKVTEGLDGLRERLEEYFDLGARFAKWRAVIVIGEGIPSRACLEVNSHVLARYAALCQEAGLVPIIEPEVLMDGKHNIDTCYNVSNIVFNHVFEELDTQSIYLQGIILKPNMIVSGIDCPKQASIDEVAQRTVECLKAVVPEKVPGCAFLSGGQNSEDATAHLNMMNAKYSDSLPWNLTFSYGRALQDSALKIWEGKDENVLLAQDSFYLRAKFNGMATTGNYSKDLEMESI